MVVSNIELKSDNWELFYERINLIESIFKELPIKIIILDENKDILYTNIEDILKENSLNLEDLISNNKIYRKNKIFVINEKMYNLDNHDIGNYKVLFLKEISRKRRK